MNRRRFLPVLLSAAIAIPAVLLVLEVLVPITVTIELECTQSGEVQVFWRQVGEPFAAERSASHSIESAGHHCVSTSIPARMRALRIDLPAAPGWVWINRLDLDRLVGLARWAADGYADWDSAQHIDHRAVKGDTLGLRIHGDDPQIVNPRAGHVLRRGLLRERLLVASVAAGLAAVAAWIATRRRRAAPSSPPRARRRWPARLGLSAAAFLVFGTPAYFLLHHGLARPGRYYPGEGDSYRLSFLDCRGNRISPESGPLGLMFDPLTFFRNYPGQRTNQFSIDDHGFRGGMGPPGKPRVFILGGSAAFGYGLPTDDFTFSARLQRRSRSYAFVNAATVGYLSGQELALMVHYLHCFRPHTYVLFNGWNDFIEIQEPGWRAAVNGQHQVLTARLQAFVEMMEKEKLPPWPFPRELPATTVEQRFEEVLALYCENLEKMSTWARATGARLLVVLQPELGNKRFRSKEEQTFGFSPDNSAKYRDFVRRADAFCATRGIPRWNALEDPAFTENEQTLFYDAVHLNPAGHEVAAEIVASFLSRLDG